MAKPPQQDRRSWRDIQQSPPKIKSTRSARERKLRLILRTSYAIFILACCAVVVMTIRYVITRVPTATTQQTSVRLDLDFRTNGVLTERWFRAHFGNVLETDLRTVNVHDIKQQLEANGQVEHAAVAAIFPARLQVQLREREPVLRARVRGQDGRPQTLLVARDGVLYRGEMYPVEFLRQLPGVAGIRIIATAEGGFEPIPNIHYVADFLDSARYRLPDFVRQWRVVHLLDWDNPVNFVPARIRVESAQVQELIFSIEGIGQQLDRLEAILEHSERYQMGWPSLIDLSFRSESVVRY